ncbi:Unconventional myosin-VIIb [Sarcoptes scabiei]|uniref:Unconventional myosin-VIIb n=1 Tax=Sarcoptes scabiei TaxID=52283 RepID=A0A834R9D6_SARSC|nr:Unconventional myosin-VIIb [Sarcoptes scabiei]
MAESMSAILGYNKVFILDKYFNELDKYWQNESLNQGFYSANLVLKVQPYLNYDNTNNDLIHLEAPITEDSLIKALHLRHSNYEYFTNVGPVLIALNPFNELQNPLTLDSVHHHDGIFPLYQVVAEAVKQQTETGYPQAIILSGIRGSGKTYSSMIILRQLFNLVGGGPQTDAFKHLSAAFTLLRSLGTAKTIENCESSRIGTFIEIQMTDKAIYRTKIHCYFLDQSRVVNTPINERNFHIFYQMLFGLTFNEKRKLYLENYSIYDFEYLNKSEEHFDHESQSQYINRFEAWQSSLSILGIPFMDVARIFAAILLLGNVKLENQLETDFNEFKNLDDLTEACLFKNEIHAVASLLGVSSALLLRGLTIRTTCSSNGQTIKSKRDFDSFQSTRDSLAKALYIRTVSTIIRRANSSKRQSSGCATLSSESNENLSQNQFETDSHNAPPSSIGSARGKSYRTIAVLNNAVKYSMEGFIGILDIFGFEHGEPSRLEQLCINLCAETMQHFYNTHIFKSSLESCRDEGIMPEFVIDYVDNVPCIDLISSLQTGLFSLIDHESFENGNAESLIQRQSSIHNCNDRYIELSKNVIYQNLIPNTKKLRKSFGIKHFYGDVIYDASDFIESNSDLLADDIVSVFHKSQCSFGFVTHLFGSELRLLKQRGSVPSGMKFRTIPSSYSDSNKSRSSTTFTQDFHNRLDNLLRTLVHARPHFVRCIKINDKEQQGYFDKFSVMKQIRALQVLETVNLMAEGLPHRMRFKTFIARYRILVQSNQLSKTDELTIENCKLILKVFSETREETNLNAAALTSWNIGRKHVFLSERARQELEVSRNNRRNYAAIMIQSLWRGHRIRKQWPYIYQMKILTKNSSILGKSDINARPRPQPIISTPPSFGSYYQIKKSSTAAIQCDYNLVRETCSLLGIDSNVAPLLPSNRSYTIFANNKYHFPQVRTLKMDYIDPMNNLKIQKGKKLIALGFSEYQRGSFNVEYKELNFDIPQQYLDRSPSTMM